jgi:hypothetical protein
LAVGAVGDFLTFKALERDCSLRGSRVNWNDIPGWFEWRSAQEEAADRFPDGSRFVEVGNFLGRSLCSLADAVRKSVTLSVSKPEYRGSNQAAVALAIWSTTPRVINYPATYNVPLHQLVDRPRLTAWPRTSPPVHVHYHWRLFTEPYYRSALDVLRHLGAGRDRLDWLAERLPLD